MQARGISPRNTKIVGPSPPKKQTVYLDPSSFSLHSGRSDETGRVTDRPATSFVLLPAVGTRQE